MSRSHATRRGIPAATWFGAQSFHTFLTLPQTGPMLDAMLHDNAATDAAILAAREDAPADDEQRGSQCGPGCGWCGRCS